MRELTRSTWSGIALASGLMSLFVISSSHAADNPPLSLFEGLQLAQYSAGDDSSPSGDSKGSYGPVRAGEDLWQIARNYRSRWISMSQVAMAIYHANPDAFYAANVNRLKLNVVLEIPGDDQIRAISHDEAYGEVSEHNAAYAKYLADRQKSVAGVESTVFVPAVKAVDSPEIVETRQGLNNEEVQLQQQPLPEPLPRDQQHHKQPLFRYSYDLSIAHDSNVRNAQKEFDILDDTVADMTLHVRGGKSVGKLSLLNYGARVAYQAFKTWDKLNNVNFDINAKYRFAFAGGFSSPVYSIGVKLGGINSESEMRDSTLFSTSLRVTKWFTDTINMTAGYEYRLRDSKSIVFDTTDNRLFINLDLDLTKTDLLYGTYTFITGDIVSSGTPDIYIVNAADAIEPDDAFGGVATNQFAYRLDGDTNVITLGYNRIMTRKTSLDFSYRYVDAETEGGITYDRSIVRFSLLGRF